MPITPRDSLEALRLMRKYQAEILGPADTEDADLKDHLQGLVAKYLSDKREGAEVEEDFLDWFENHDVSAESEAEPDPTG